MNAAFADLVDARAQLLADTLQTLAPVPEGTTAPTPAAFANPLHLAPQQLTELSTLIGPASEVTRIESLRDLARVPVIDLDGLPFAVQRYDAGEGPTTRLIIRTGFQPGPGVGIEDMIQTLDAVRDGLREQFNDNAPRFGDGPLAGDRLELDVEWVREPGSIWDARRTR